jgi:cytochrome c-type biogenesis protein CcmH/NrfG
VSSPPTRLVAATLVLYALIAVLVAGNYRELNWAASRLPGYFAGQIPGSIRENQLLRSARSALVDDRDPEKSLVIVDELLRMDNSSAEGWLLRGRSHYAMHHMDQADTALLQAVALDPTLLEAYLYLAKIYSEQNRPQRARAILTQGRDYFQQCVQDYEPKLDSSVPRKFNRKATRVHEEHRRKLQLIQSRLAYLDTGPATAP